jgi:hypothetical protein
MLRRFRAFAVSALVALALASVPASVHAADSPCLLLHQTKTADIAIPRGSINEMFSTCQLGYCLQHYTDADGQKKCALAHGATTTFKCGKARAMVRRELRRGYRRINVGADLAGIASNAGGTAVLMAVGRTFVAFTMGASSDDNPRPTWPAAKQFVIRGARNLAKYLHRHSHAAC